VRKRKSWRWETSSLIPGKNEAGGLSGKGEAMESVHHPLASFFILVYDIAGELNSGIQKVFFDNIASPGGEGGNNAAQEKAA
jgi:hypothetical protein